MGACGCDAAPRKDGVMPETVFRTEGLTKIYDTGEVKVYETDGVVGRL